MVGGSTFNHFLMVDFLLSANNIAGSLFIFNVPCFREQITQIHRFTFEWNIYAKHIFYMFVDLLPESPDHLAVPKYMKVVGLLRPTALMLFLNGCDKKSHSIFPTCGICSTLLKTIVALQRDQHLSFLFPLYSLCIHYSLVWIIGWH